MSAFLQNAAGDYQLVNGSMLVIDNTTSIPGVCQPGQETLQNIRSNLRFFQGEYFLDQSVGMPYWQTLLAKGITLDVIEGIYRQAILDTDGVLSINSLTATLDNAARSLVINFSVQSVNGTITGTQTI